VISWDTTMAEFKYLVRIANTDLDGNKGIGQSLTKIKGVGIVLAHAVLHQAHVEDNRKTGELSDSEIKKIDTVVKGINESELPSWLYNRRKDYDTGKDMHIIGVDLHLAKDFDLKRLKKIKTYRGVRHMFNLPVRGQRTKANFRRNKGKVMGVKRKGKKSGRV